MRFWSLPWSSLIFLHFAVLISTMIKSNIPTFCGSLSWTSSIPLQSCSYVSFRGGLNSAQLICYCFAFYGGLMWVVAVCWSDLQIIYYTFSFKFTMLDIEFDFLVFNAISNNSSPLALSQVIVNVDSKCEYKCITLTFSDRNNGALCYK